jgi:uncharacterized membrane protein YjfL (UPF0719 family)
LDFDEWCVLFGSMMLAQSVALRWCIRLFSVQSAPRKRALAIRLLLGVWPIGLLLALGVTLCIGAAREVREDLGYVALFVALGAVWLAAIAHGMAWLGVSASDDALERNNPSAAVAVTGALTGGLLVYGFANLGEGDTIWTTIGPAALASLTYFALFALHQATSGAPDAIAIDRDVASGVRFSGMAVGTGLIVGRAIAGDYQSAIATFRDFVRLRWPAVPLVLLAAFVQRRLEPRPKSRDALTAGGLVPALVYVAFGLLDLTVRGSWAAKGGP